MSGASIGIIGGGPGGLITAYYLQKMSSIPCNITIFEASHRLGGKILTPHFDVVPIRYEAGAAEFYDYSQFDDDPLKELIDELGLSTCPMGGPGVVLQGKLLANLDDLQTVYGISAVQAVRNFDRTARDLITPLEFYNADDPEGCIPPSGGDLQSIVGQMPLSVAQQFVTTLIHSDLATEPTKTSTEYGLQNYLMNDPAYMQLYGIVGGNEQLPQELVRRLSATFRMDTRVQEISRSQGKIRVQSSSNQNEQFDEFDYVVVALPHNYLGGLKYGERILADAMTRHIAHYHHPAHYLRITILFDRPAWRDYCSESYWMLDQFSGCCLYDESSRDASCSYGILGWLLGGDAAETHSERTDEELTSLAMQSLNQFPWANNLKKLEVRIHRWLGAVNAMPGGKTPVCQDRKHQPEPEQHPNLFLVGDYLYDSTINGVVDSAYYVAGWIAAELLQPAPQQPKQTTPTTKPRKETRTYAFRE
ncbi:MAG: FAD-dependent oxidoreductase [Zavarzinella sp.]